MYSEKKIRLGLCNYSVYTGGSLSTCTLFIGKSCSATQVVIGFVKLLLCYSIHENVMILLSEKVSLFWVKKCLERATAEQ